MHTAILELDAAYYRSKYSRETAHRRLVAQAPTVPRTGPRRRLSRALVLVGTRLQGMRSPTATPTPLVDPATIAPTSQ